MYLFLLIHFTWGQGSLLAGVRLHRQVKKYRLVELEPLGTCLNLIHVTWATHLPFLVKLHHLVDRKWLSQNAALWMWVSISPNGQVSDHPAQHSPPDFGITEIFVVIRRFPPHGYSEVSDEIFLMFLMQDGMCLPIIEDSASTGKLSNMLHSQHDTKI